jgi:hypothetical protein
MLADADVVEQSERQWIAKGMRGPCGSVEIAPGVNMLASPSEVPRNQYAMLWDADVNDRTERQFVASGMAQAGRLALLSEDTGAVISIP